MGSYDVHLIREDKNIIAAFDSEEEAADFCEALSDRQTMIDTITVSASAEDALKGL